MFCKYEKYLSKGCSLTGNLIVIKITDSIFHVTFVGMGPTWLMNLYDDIMCTSLCQEFVSFLKISKLSPVSVQIQGGYDEISCYFGD